MAPVIPAHLLNELHPNHHQPFPPRFVPNLRDLVQDPFRGILRQRLSSGQAFPGCPGPPGFRGLGGLSYRAVGMLNTQFSYRSKFSRVFRVR
ncbi:hypothetical protein KS4_35650 [Poriferisphaera corsica]|uniref:Uncharacterized protein n=1 Tax=Poriferisphaera corsica TaxID=2528020 RepID=A0A517YZ31_9BACT|nr:hypothetical protein KS4_35650 [Poriferisphaera corsica]